MFPKDQTDLLGCCQKCKKDTYICWRNKCRDSINGSGHQKIGNKSMQPIDDYHTVLPDYKYRQEVKNSIWDDKKLTKRINC